VTAALLPSAIRYPLSAFRSRTARTVEGD